MLLGLKRAGYLNLLVRYMGVASGINAVGELK